jgi:hypothetical protein
VPFRGGDGRQGTGTIVGAVPVLVDERLTPVPYVSITHRHDRPHDHDPDPDQIVVDNLRDEVERRAI